MEEGTACRDCSSRSVLGSFWLRSRRPRRLRQRRVRRTAITPSCSTRRVATGSTSRQKPAETPSAYKEVRTRQAYELTLEQLKKMGKADSDLGPMLKGAAGWQTDMSQLTFVRCDATTRVARLLYKREGSGPKGPTLEFAAFMIHWDDGAWRIGWVAQSSGAATRSNGEKRTADELLGDPRFALN
jgi:hypothetical protein